MVTIDIEINQNYTAAYFYRGLANSNKGNKDAAILDYNKAIELNPKYAEAYNYRGSAKDDKGDWEGAILDFNKAIEIDPKKPDGYISGHKAVLRSVIPGRGILSAGRDMPRWQGRFARRGLIDLPRQPLQRPGHPAHGEVHYTARAWLPQNPDCADSSTHSLP